VLSRYGDQPSVLANKAAEQDSWGTKLAPEPSPELGDLRIPYCGTDGQSERRTIVGDTGHFRPRRRWQPAHTWWWPSAPHAANRTIAK